MYVSAFVKILLSEDIRNICDIIFYKKLSFSQTDEITILHVQIRFNIMNWYQTETYYKSYHGYYLNPARALYKYGIILYQTCLL